MIVPGSAYKFAMGTLQPEDLSPPGSLLEGRCTNGLAWAAPRELLRARGFYDARIVGSGDKSILCAAIGRPELAERAGSMNSRQREHYRAWAEPFFAATRSRVGYVGGRIFHLWHGDSRDRQYDRRHLNLGRFEFDPYVDIAFDANGAWRWNTHKPQLHEFVRGYFQSRNEDGRAPGDPADHRKPRSAFTDP
jgi:hypothetical protein